jgi:hypothetical protein
MNSIKCPACNVTNWLSDKICVRCKAALSGIGAPTSQLRTSAQSQEDGRRTSIPGPVYFAAVGVALLLVLTISYKMTRPAAKLYDPRTPAEIAAQRAILAGNESSKKPVWDFATSPVAETFGVRPFSNVKDAQSEAEKTVYDLTTTMHTGTRSVIERGGASVESGKTWSKVTTEPTSQLKTLCKSVLYGTEFKGVTYEKYENTVYAVVSVAVDSECKSSRPRGIATALVRYEWADVEPGTLGWKLCPDSCFNKMGAKLRQIEEKAASDTEARKQDKQTEAERKRRLEQELRQFRN